MAGVAADGHADRRRLKTCGLSGEESASRRRRDEGEYFPRQRCDSCRSGVFAFAQALPRLQAEELVKKACVVAVAENKSLIDIVKQLAGDSATAINWQTLAQPENYLGESDRIIDRVLELARRHF